LGENINLEGVAFLKKIKKSVKKYFKGVITIAEESTTFPKVTEKVEDGGLGFDYKWNLGWMNDTLFYCREDPYFRNHHHNKITFSLTYAFSEKFILPISHDEVVHVKGSVVNKMPGEYVDKFAGERLLIAFMYAHPGKKLNFMGYEVAQFKEWDYTTGLDLFLADEFELHKKMRIFVKELNRLYSQNKPLYEIDNGWDGFKWLVVDDRFNNLFAFSRYSKNGEELVAVMNFSGIDLINYNIKLSEGKYRLILNTDDTKFGGHGKIKKRIFNTIKNKDSQENFLKINVPKLTCMYLIKLS
ncbi:MAG: alpha amylase C-terminal domain-containing protein, partial [Clostridia bacterium]|nr:alpha amylase C-terminal domain-containing protein [Clostridia bacterium]